VQDSQAFKLTMSGAVSNVINQTIFGRRLDYNNPNLEGIQQFEGFITAAARSMVLPLYQVSIEQDVWLAVL